MRWLVSLFIAMLATCAEAGTVQGSIANVYQRASDGLIVVYINGTNAGRPTCASGTQYWMVRDENSNVGKGHFATLLAAKIAGKSVSIQGSGTCARWGDGEDIEYVSILD